MSNVLYVYHQCYLYIKPQSLNDYNLYEKKTQQWLIGIETLGVSPYEKPHSGNHLLA